ncbi:CHAT domain-containing protein [Amycolatopsis xylanica]|nr:CHAT domain-containing protein [Amycolatopsis xylanica]
MMRRGLAMLDSIESPGDGDWLVTRIRLLISLTYFSRDVSGIEAAQAELEKVWPLIAQVDDARLRAELSGSVHHNQALILLAVGRNDEGIGYLDKSIELQREGLATADDPVVALDRYLKSLFSRGVARTRAGDVRGAREDLTHAISLAEEHGALGQAADSRRQLGTLELRIGDVPAALRCYAESEQFYAERGVAIPFFLRVGQAEALLTAGLADEAGAYFDDVLPAMREQRGFTPDLSFVELMRATAALLNDELELARQMAASARKGMVRWGCQTCAADAAIIGLRADLREALRSGEVSPSLTARALRIAKSMPARLADRAASARMLAARLEIRRGNLRRAAELLRRIPRPGEVTPIDYRMLRRLCRAELAAGQGDRAKAFTEIRAGLGELDRVRDRMGGLELVSGTALHGRELAGLAMKLVLDGGTARRVFDWLERTRAQTHRYEPIAGADDPEVAERIAEMRGLDQAIHQAQHLGHPTSALRAKYAERLRESHRLGWDAGRWGKPRPVATVNQVAEALGDRALVSFAVSDDAVVAVVVADGAVRLVRLGSAKSAGEHARRLNVDLNALAPDHLPPMLVEAVMGSARRQAELLDAQLIRPLTMLGHRDLVIVPTGALYAVPWGVLPSLQSRPAVVAPSATAWLAAEHTRTPRARKIVLARGPDLPAARGEIDKLATHHQGANLLSGSRATVKSVLRALDGAKLAHIAAHGAHEPENALFSRLELADGALFAHEIAGLKQPPRQVVLAACELALNRIRPGDEALGFASALLASGSRTVIAPLSRVGDQAAAAAMDDYHRGLANATSPASALADAIGADPFRRPFVCLGAG